MHPGSFFTYSTVSPPTSMDVKMWGFFAFSGVGTPGMLQEDLSGC